MHNRLSRKKRKVISLISVFIWLSVMAHPLIAAEKSASALHSLREKRVALVIPFARYNRFMHEEITRAFEMHGVKVTVVSSQLGMAAPNKGERYVEVGMTLDQVDMARFDALVFSGGGALYSEFANKPITKAVVKKAISLSRVVAGIDLGKAVLVNTGIIDYQIPKERDAVGAAVTVSGKVITGNSQYVIDPFIAALLKVLQYE